MPEQNEWIPDRSGHTVNAKPAVRVDRTPQAVTTNTQHVDSGDYTWEPKPAPVVDCHTYNAKINEDIADLKTALVVLTDEVQHLRETIARIAKGESTL